VYLDVGSHYDYAHNNTTRSKLEIFNLTDKSLRPAGYRTRSTHSENGSATIKHTNQFVAAIAVSIVTRLPVGRPGFDSLQGTGCFRHRVKTGLGPIQTPIQWVPGALSPE